MSSPLNSALRLATKLLPKSNSAKAFDAARANKTGLSKALDVTLRTDHDMRVFGLGFMASLSSADVYRHFMQQHYFFYRAMEQQFDACVEQREASPMSQVWQQYATDLRRSDALLADLQAVAVSPHAPEGSPSPATAAYVSRIESIGVNAAAGGPGGEGQSDQKDQSHRLLGHFYCRYFADMFGGSVLGSPTRMAVRLPETPAFYQFPGVFSPDRATYINQVYARINEHGGVLSEEQQAEVVDEAKMAFALNAGVYKEPHSSLALPAVIGTAQVCLGAVRELVVGRPSVTA